MNRASASPSISSLVDPPNQALTSPSIAAQSFFNQQQARLHRDEAQASVPPSPTANRLAPSIVNETSSGPAPPSASSMNPKKVVHNAAAPAGPTAMAKKNSMGYGSTATSSAAASPKPPKPKDVKDLYPTPPPLPGSGLMQLGGIGGGPGDGTEFRAPTVILNIPMKGEVNKIINFTRMAEEQYGWDALHPRLAAQRDRLARVAAAGAALERNGSSKDSGDDMSLDSDGEGSNVEMGGMSDGRTGTDGGAKKVPRKRKMKEDEYDKDDGFVDDSELLWEEQAAAATDGFFVYSGPLIPEGEKPALDLRADGAPKRGRGRGSRGGATRGASTRGGAVGINARTGLPLSGPGSRGGSTTRKPRITKADRQRMEQEKLDREKMGSMASMPAGYSGMTQLASATSMGTTPMAGIRFVAFDQYKSMLQDAEGNISGPRTVIAGFGAGVTESLLAVTPFESIKTTLIDDRKSANPRMRGFLHAVPIIARERGLRGFFQGFVPTTARQAANSATRFGSYTFLRQLAQSYTAPGEKLGAISTFGIGGIAGLITVYVTQPLDTVKTRMQSIEAKSLYKNSFACAALIAKNEGVLTFWSGALPRLARLMLSGGIVFTMYEKSIDLMDRLDPDKRYI
ncbi:hypothetical protein G7Y89_g14234 [Cudoniella acicularis]|uniref:Hpc2-related domain-containing protein n=1 Tax=Cudoniella acicularis TaxID=354080 RepID=A0A8H4R5Y1_9HELO|nr:hypothetical protein G7Y89_g14234 [Cudoniella acicularis]